MKIEVTVTNRLGTFIGFLQTEQPLTEVEANETIDTLISSINHLRHLGLRADDGSQLVFGEKVIRESILQFSIVA